MTLNSHRRCEFKVTPAQAGVHLCRPGSIFAGRGPSLQALVLYQHLYRGTGPGLSYSDVASLA